MLKEKTGGLLGALVLDRLRLLATPKKVAAVEGRLVAG